MEEEKSYLENEESEEEQNEYEQDDGFIDDNTYSDHSSPKEKRKKRKRKHVVKEEELDEDDLDLVKENTTVKNKRKRLVKEKAKNEDSARYEDEESQGAGEEFIEGGAETGVDQQQMDLYGDIFDGGSDSEEEQEEMIHEKEDELKTKMKSDEDLRTEIARVDIPERIYERLRGRLEPTDEEIEEEAKWILASKHHWKGSHSGEEKMLESIKCVLKLFRKNHYDIPFITTYKSYLFQAELQQSDCWDIYELDLEWNNFLGSRNAIKKKLDEVRAHITDAEVLDECLNSASSNYDLHDVLNYINFCKSTTPAIKEKKTNLRDFKKRNYVRMMEAKIDQFAHEISLKPADFAKNLRANQLVAKIKRMSSAPSVCAESYITPKMSEILDVLINTVSFIADEISSHPVIKKLVLEKYLAGLKISTSPTAKGERELDVFHQSYRVKRLKIVPLDKFKDDLWTDIQQCKENGLIEVSFEHDEVLRDIIDWMKGLYYEPYQGDRNEKDWKTFYDEIIDRVIGTNMKPELEKRAVQELEQRSHNFITSKVKDSFQNILMVPPYLFQKKPCNVVSLIITTAGAPSLTAAHVNEVGDFRNHRVFSYICMPYADKNQPEKYEEDINQLRDFIFDAKAGLIVIGANSPDARQLKNVVKEKIVSDENTISKLGHEPWVSYGSLEVPMIAANSPSYIQNFKTVPTVTRQAVSLARFKQSPVAETLKLWNESDKENMHIFSLNLHHFQKYVPKAKLVETLRNVAVNCVNKIGIDLFQTMMNANFISCLPFVSGLGEIKANDFLKKFITSEDNDKFRYGTSILPTHVHYNAVGFMNASKYSKSKSNKGPRALDSTRIHPEFYSIATKMAKSALDEDQDSEDAIAAIMRDPTKLRQLDLEQFSQRCETMFGKDYKSIFYFIRDELESPFRDIRGEYAEYESKMINQDANLFYMLTGENPQTFYEGILVPVNVTRVVNQDGFACKSLGKSNWSAFLPRDQVDPSKENSITPGYVLTAKVTRIEYDNLSVKLSATGETINEKEALDRVHPAYRPHFKVDIENDIQTKTLSENKNRFGPGNKYTLRNVNYQHYKNVSVGKAIESLKDKPRGNFVLRPNPRGKQWFNLTYKFYDTQIIHLEVQEKKDGDNAEYSIGDAKFSNLQELEVRFCKELLKRVNELVGSPKFKSFRTEDDFKAFIIKEKAKNPANIPYFFTILPDHAQHAVLGYIPGNDPNKVKIEYIKVKHKGFFFHDKLYPNMTQLIIFFKKNFSSRTYRRYVESKKRVAPTTRVCRDIEEEPVDPSAPVPNELSEWTGDANPGQTQYPAKTNYVGDVGESSWGGASVAQADGGSSGWGGGGFKQERPVKSESGWGSNSGFAEPEASGWGGNKRDSWGGDKGNFSQDSNRSGGRGGFRGRGRGGFRGRGGGDRPGGRDCFKCGEPGHFARECPNSDGGFGGGRRRRDDDDGGFRRGRRDDRGGFGGESGGWGASGGDNAGSSWGAAKSNDGGASGWGANKSEHDGGATSGWGANKSEHNNGSSSGWGANKQEQDGGASGWN